MESMLIFLQKFVFVLKSKDALLMVNYLTPTIYMYILVLEPVLSVRTEVKIKLIWPDISKLTSFPST